MMKAKLVEKQPKTYLLVFEAGDEIVSNLKTFATKNGLAGSSFKTIGALADAKVGWFSWETKKYETAAEIHEQVEVLSLYRRYRA
jgi:predicted DNA-binding protein with PD1-like motif